MSGAGVDANDGAATTAVLAPKLNLNGGTVVEDATADAGAGVGANDGAATAAVLAPKLNPDKELNRDKKLNWGILCSSFLHNGHITEAPFLTVYVSMQLRWNS